MDKEHLAIARLPCDWQTGMDVFRWWMEDDNISGQLSMDDLMEDNNV